MWDPLWLLLAPGSGLLYLISRLAYRLHMDAVDAERRRADDWREAARTAEARADLRDRQMAEVLASIRQVKPT